MVDVVEGSESITNIITDEYLDEECDRALTREQVNDFAAESTHLLLLRQDGKVVTFGLLQGGKKVNELLVLCGTYTINGVKGSKLIVDKAIEIGKGYGNKTLVLKAANEALAEKVYEPMGFTRTGKSLMMSRSIGGSRLQKQTRRSKRHTRNHKRRKLRNLTTRRR